MEIIRKSLKVYVITFVLFIVLTLILAALICFTGFKESWGYGGMMAVIGISAITYGIFDAKVVGRRALFVFLISAMMFVLIIYLLIFGLFA